MPETDNLSDAQIVFVYANIGRGHPSYLDGIIEKMNADHPGIFYFVADVFSSGSISTRIVWSAVKWLYRFGSRGGLITRLYNGLRKGTGGENAGWLSDFILGRDIKKMLNLFPGLVVVAHPLLARILKGRNRVIYQHGELIFPVEAVVAEVEAILVPTLDVAKQAQNMGVESSRIIVTGQCIESGLISNNESVYASRLDRYRSQSPLTAAMFTSGAFPPHHLELLFRISCSLAQNEIEQYLFFGQSIRERERFGARLKRSNINIADTISDSANVHLISCSSRAEENLMVSDIFERIDFFVAPAHERTNWAVGLGLPMMILTPHIGSYAPLNARLAVDRMVAIEVNADDADDLAGIVTDLRDQGKLTAMSRSGYHPEKISGLKFSADFLADLH